jgi:hypothetical protein
VFAVWPWPWSWSWSWVLVSWLLDLLAGWADTTALWAVGCGLLLAAGCLVFGVGVWCFVCRLASRLFTSYFAVQHWQHRIAAHRAPLPAAPRSSGGVHGPPPVAPPTAMSYVICHHSSPPLFASPASLARLAQARGAVAVTQHPPPPRGRPRGCWLPAAPWCLRCPSVCLGLGCGVAIRRDAVLPLRGWGSVGYI